MSSSNQKNGAWSLLEIIVILSILTMLCAFGVIPAFNALFKNAQADSVMIQLYHTLQFARHEAIRRQVFITLCPSSDLKTCRRDNDWSQGYLVFIDPNGRGIVSTHKNILSIIQGLSSGRLTWRGFPRKPYLQWTPSGLTNYQNGTFQYCPEDQDAHFARALFMIQTGRARFAEDHDRDGFREDSQGSPLRCPSH